MHIYNTIACSFAKMLMSYNRSSCENAYGTEESLAANAYLPAAVNKALRRPVPRHPIHRTAVPPLLLCPDSLITIAVICNTT